MKTERRPGSRFQHPRTAQFHRHLVSIDFAARFDALCRAHEGPPRELSASAKRSALRGAGRRLRFSELCGSYLWREAWRTPSGLPKYTAIGLDIRMSDRVELELLFATPDGHLSGSFPRLVADALPAPRSEAEPPDRAPRIGSADELGVILEESFALYDDLVRMLKSDSWWDLSPSFMLDGAAPEPGYQLAA